MKIHYKYVDRCTIEEFADKYGLVMVVRELSQPRLEFMAYFKEVTVVGLYGVYGIGNTPEAAIACYGDKISGGMIVIDAELPTRREIKVPWLCEKAAMTAARMEALARKAAP